MALGVADRTKIHQGPGFFYKNIAPPATGKRHLIASDGTPTQPVWAATTAYTAGQGIVDSNGNIQICSVAGTSGAAVPAWPTAVGQTIVDGTVTWTTRALGPAYQFAGALEGVTDLDVAQKIEEVLADQETLPVDAVMTGEAAGLTATLKESDMTKMQLDLPHGTFATGTDTGLPAGSQAYEEIAFGGLKFIPRNGILLISPRKDSITKFIVSCLYQAYQKTPIKLGFQRAKESVYKVDWIAIADVLRPVGDRGGKLYRQM